MWQPSASFEALKARAAILATIRQFFAERDVMEVDTPVMSHGTVTDPFVVGIPALFQLMGSSHQDTMYLQTSPEYAMKRLLAAGFGAIYQITKAFRQGEISKVHNPEFTMLEWYRPGYDHHQLMNEMDLLLQAVLNVQPADKLTYAQAFKNYVQLCPHSASVTDLLACLTHHQINLHDAVDEKDVLLDIIWSHVIEPQVGAIKPLFLYDFPASQASLSKIRHEHPSVASRFEVYFKGVELANGFHELQDFAEQQRRFAKDLNYRAKHQLPELVMDNRLLAALESGLPDCAGVALGIDRLVMLALDCEHINQVISFTHERA
jgi:lysyl-tRNA synthetase class 2